MAGHVYILASRRHGTLYIGVTTDLAKRIYEHREGLIPGFTRRYRVKRLVFVETYDNIDDAIVREKQLKEWRRAWKIQLIEQENPDWQDLAISLLGFEPLNSGDIRVHGSRLPPG
jgi:putative endonuclease